MSKGLGNILKGLIFTGYSMPSLVKEGIGSHATTEKQIFMQSHAALDSFTAHTLYSGIFATGSRAELVKTLAAALA